MHFVELQNLQKHRAMDEKSFYINDDVFLTSASQPAESFIEVRIEVSLSYLRHYSYPWGQDPPFLCHNYAVKHFLVRLISIRVAPTT